MNIENRDHLVNIFGQKISVGSEIVYIPTHSWGRPRVGKLKSVAVRINEYKHNGKEYKHEWPQIEIMGVNSAPRRWIYKPHGESDYVDMKPYFYTREITSTSVFLLDSFDMSNIDEKTQKDVDFLRSLSQQEKR